VTVEAWLEAYARAWRERDPDAAVALFTEDAVYRSHAFREPHRGSEEIRRYWAGATRDQVDVGVELGEPIVEGERVAVEWWTTMREGGEDVTLPGCLVLRFADDGRCEELREYWFFEPGKHPPHEGWGR
jgi:ketosteroid isomerase-like protein